MHLDSISLRAIYAAPLELKSEQKQFLLMVKERFNGLCRNNVFIQFLGILFGIFNINNIIRDAQPITYRSGSWQIAQPANRI